MPEKGKLKTNVEPASFLSLQVHSLRGSGKTSSSAVTTYRGEVLKPLIERSLNCDLCGLLATGFGNNDGPYPQVAKSDFPPPIRNCENHICVYKHWRKRASKFNG